jgi:hypothetical protein
MHRPEESMHLGLAAQRREFAEEFFMSRWPLAVLLLAVSLHADTLQPISIDFAEFALQPGSAPTPVGSFYQASTGLYDPAAAFATHWVAIYNYEINQTVGSFLYHAPGVIAGSLGMFQSVSFSIAGGLSSAPTATLPIQVLDNAGNVLAEQSVAYTGGLGSFQPVTIAFAGRGAEINFGQLGGLDASDYEFTDFQTWVGPAVNDPADTPEPRYAVFTGAGLLLIGMLRRRTAAWKR